MDLLPIERQNHTRKLCYPEEKAAARNNEAARGTPPQRAASKGRKRA